MTPPPERKSASDGGVPFSAAALIASAAFAVASDGGEEAQ